MAVLEITYKREDDICTLLHEYNGMYFYQSENMACIYIVSGTYVVGSIGTDCGTELEWIEG